MSNVDKSGLPKQTETIKYIRKDIPAFDVPEYKGKSCEVLVPDTLDIEERAALAVNGLTGPTNPDADYTLYFFGFLLHNPPMMWLDASSTCIAKFWESLPLMRLISGSDLNKHVEQRWMEVMLRMIGPDGLAYFPLKGQPWLRRNFPSVCGISIEPDCEHFALPVSLGRQLSAMTLYYLITGNKVWKQAGENMVNGLVRRAIEKDNYAYFPYVITLDAPVVRDAKVPTGLLTTHPAWVIQGLIYYYRATGYEPALTLSGKLANHVRNGGYYGADGSFLPHLEPGYIEPGSAYALVHFHMHTMGLLGLLEYAIAAGDKEMIEYVRKGYEYAKSKGNVLVGFFPEYIGYAGRMNSEICEVADMITLGLKLSKVGAGDYWDDVDRWIRNQFIEGQLLHVDWVYRNASQLPVSSIDESFETADRVPERNIGAFAGWPSANDWVGNPENPFRTPQNIGMNIQHCCTGNATRAMYYIWENILDYENGRLRVNLLLNRASEWADIDSHIPYTGEVDVKVKKDLKLTIRIPEWVRPEEVKTMVNGKERQITFDGRYNKVGSVKPSDIVTMTFPIKEREDKVFIEKKQYSLVRKGNDVVLIDPPGYYCPLYQRSHYRQNNTRWKKVTRFISSDSLCW